MSNSRNCTLRSKKANANNRAETNMILESIGFKYTSIYSITPLDKYGAVNLVFNNDECNILRGCRKNYHLS